MKKIFHGWWMVGAAGAMQFVQGTLLLQSFGAYFAVLRDDRGWSKTELAGAAAIHQVEAAVLGPVIGWFIDRFLAQAQQLFYFSPRLIGGALVFSVLLGAAAAIYATTRVVALSPAEAIRRGA